MIEIDGFRAERFERRRGGRTLPGVRVTHLETGARAEAAESPDETANLEIALRRLVKQRRFANWKRAKASSAAEVIAAARRDAGTLAGAEVETLRIAARQMAKSDALERRGDGEG